jgi:hypothetical protein
MRLLSYLVNGKPHYGVAKDDGAVDLSVRIDAEFADLKTLIAREGLEIARQASAGQSPDHALDKLTLLPPVLAPEKLWCIGVNYRDRNAEYKDNSALPNIRACSCAILLRWWDRTRASRSRKSPSSSTMRANSSS